MSPGSISLSGNRPYPFSFLCGCSSRTIDKAVFTKDIIYKSRIIETLLRRCHTARHNRLRQEPRRSILSECEGHLLYCCYQSFRGAILYPIPLSAVTKVLSRYSAVLLMLCLVLNCPMMCYPSRIRLKRRHES